MRTGTDPPKEVPKEEFEKLEEKLEELKQEAAADLADDGSVDSELEERIKELQETLVDVVPVEKGPPTGLRLFRAVWKSKFYGVFALNLRVDLHATDATPARWRGDAGSSQLDGARTATSSPRNGLSEELSGAPDALVDFHTA